MCDLVKNVTRMHNFFEMKKILILCLQIEGVKVEGFPTLKYFPAGSGEVCSLDFDLFSL